MNLNKALRFGEFSKSCQRFRYDLRKVVLSLMILTSAFSMAQNPWIISAEHPEASPYFGETVANGILGLVSSQEPLSNSKVILAGTYDKYGRGNVTNYIDNIRFMNMNMFIDGKEIKADNISNSKQQLDMHHGCFSSQFTVNGKADVKSTQYALRQLPYNALTIVEITPSSDIHVSIANKPVVPNVLKSSRCRYHEMTKRKGNIHLFSTEAQSPTGRLNIVSSASFVFENNNCPTITADTINNQVSFTLNLKKGEHYKFALVGSIISSAQTADPENEAERLTIIAALDGINLLVERHCSLWNDLWQSDIVIDGDARTQQDIRSMMYHLYSFVREGSRLSISPMGLSGLGYNGHVFWDADIWMMPALLLLHPEMARSMIDYRIDRLKAARQNAFEHGYQGAMFPWESSETGMEETPTWALTGTYEHHITGCVALAAWNYFLVTRDTLWLRREAYQLISDAADFWVSRIEVNRDGTAHVLNVCGADEYAVNVDDNAFTNAVAMKNMQVAADAAKLLGERPHAAWLQYRNALSITQMENGVTREHASYNGENIKQADVNLLAYPLGLITDRKQIEKDIDYYAKRVPKENTPAMTESIFALLYARLGDSDKATDYFFKSYRQNQCPPFGVIAECKGGKNPYFITGAGGVLQAVIMGFAGYDISPEGVRTVESSKPQGWKSINVKIDRTIRVIQAKHDE